MTTGAAGVPQFPGAVGLSTLDVYPWEAPDGLHGGSPHVHTCCAECYVVVAGTGELHTLTAAGAQRTPLAPGDVVWFTPGTVHRAVDTGGLRVVVVMENGGLPEAGDAVLTFPPQHLADPEAYARAASILGPDGRPSAERARARRDLAVEGHAELLRRTEAGDASALAEFHTAAAALVAPRLAEFRARWEAGAAETARRTGEHLAALERGDATHLGTARVVHLPRPATTLGMCGHLAAHDGPRRALARP